jgi:hypothetical protein
MLPVRIGSFSVPTPHGTGTADWRAAIHEGGVLDDGPRTDVNGGSFEGDLHPLWGARGVRRTGGTSSITPGLLRASRSWRRLVS